MILCKKKEKSFKIIYKNGIIEGLNQYPICQIIKTKTKVKLFLSYDHRYDHRS